MRSTEVQRLRFLLLFLLVACIACGKRPAGKVIAWRDLAAGELEARSTGKPALVYVCAEWSVACKELDRSFDDPAVRAATERYVPIRIDATDDDQPATEKARSRFAIVGLPTVLALDFLDVASPAGRAFERYRVNQYVRPQELARELGRAANEHATRLAAVRAEMRAARADATRAPWPTDLAAVQAEATAQKKPLVLIVAWTWTMASGHMEQTTLQHPLIRDLLADYAVARIETTDAEARRRHITEPTVLVLDTNGNETYRATAWASVEAVATMLQRERTVR